MGIVEDEDLAFGTRLCAAAWVNDVAQLQQLWGDGSRLQRVYMLKENVLSSAAAGDSVEALEWTRAQVGEARWTRSQALCLAAAAQWGRREMLEHMLDTMGVDVDARGEKSGFTPLMLASGEGCTLGVSLLLERGADPAAQSDQRNTALWKPLAPHWRATAAWTSRSPPSCRASSTADCR